MCMNVYSNFIHNHLKWKTTRMPISWKTDEQIGVHPCSGIPFSSSNRKELAANIGSKVVRLQSILPVENMKRSCCWGSIDVTSW